MIVGIGVDIVSVERFTRHARQSAGVLERLFRSSELVSASRSTLGWHVLAARFAAKEAVAKTLGVRLAFEWHDFAISRAATGAPVLELTGRGAEEANRLGVRSWHLSLNQNAGLAFATAIASSR